ncbi:hypothetical protein HGRIS_004047 [Hohenbuehelia grisea]|uniref:Uncharacterized protein n=1 Tax=Hohenbuehelia grisea TaxID=104357 RepID=A0ABR3JHN1_9AGAR
MATTLILATPLPPSTTSSSSASPSSTPPAIIEHIQYRPPIHWGTPDLVGQVLGKTLNNTNGGHELHSVGWLLNRIGKDYQELDAPGFWKNFGRALKLSIGTFFRRLPDMAEAGVKLLA